ncbi:winged helix-turn-helix domain-containing protein [Streptomyces sp. NPDC006529]|uniref:winged helix-turn-helix domain-containing protein n=1 Tax=Streptomyces sp. NPDC006529 TaxID=3157177 RepID=UPI0033BD1BEA
MLELRLNVEDLARIHVVSTLGVAFETHFAWSRLAEQQRDGLAEWRRTTRHRMRRTSTVHSALEPPLSLLETLTSPVPREGDLFHATAVEPFWDRISRALKAERDACGRAMLAGGMEHVLNSLHHAIRWTSPVLRVANSQAPRTADLAGRGMTIVPSLFAPQPFLIDAHMGWQGLPILVYNITPDPESATAMWQGQEGESALRDLLGRTRADVLATLQKARSTGEIADRLQISSPSASKHITVLRRAGFVTTERRQNCSVHTLTPLGEAILG